MRKVLAALFFILGFAAMAQAQSASIAWAPDTVDPSPTYNVYRSSRISGQSDSFSQVATGLSLTSYTDSAVSHGQSYAYYVTTVSGGIESTNRSNTILVYVIASDGSFTHAGARAHQDKR